MCEEAAAPELVSLTVTYWLQSVNIISFYCTPQSDYTLGIQILFEQIYTSRINSVDCFSEKAAADSFIWISFCSRALCSPKL